MAVVSRSRIGGGLDYAEESLAAAKQSLAAAKQSLTCAPHVPCVPDMITTSFSKMVYPLHISASYL